MFFEVRNSVFEGLDIITEFADALVAIAAQKTANLSGFVTMVYGHISNFAVMFVVSLGCFWLTTNRTKTILRVQHDVVIGDCHSVEFPKPCFSAFVMYFYSSVWAIPLGFFLFSLSESFTCSAAEFFAKSSRWHVSKICNRFCEIAFGAGHLVERTLVRLILGNLISFLPFLGDAIFANDSSAICAVFVFVKKTYVSFHHAVSALLCLVFKISYGHDRSIAGRFAL